MGLTFDDFCREYNLSAAAKEGLTALGFEMGDDLSIVMDVEYKEVGFQALSWDHVHCAYRKYKQDYKSWFLHFCAMHYDSQIP